MFALINMNLYDLYLVARGVRRYLALGPGKALRALARRNLGDATAIEIIDDLRAVAGAAEEPVHDVA
jgi:hypothetical protein